MKKTLWLIAIAVVISLPAYGWMLSPIVSSTPMGADVTAPQFSSATINGTALVVNWTEACTRGGSYNNTQLDLDMSTTGANIGVTYQSGDGTAQWTYTAASAAVNGETVDLDFDGTANSIEDGSGNDLAALVSSSVTNNTPAGASVTDTFTDTDSTLLTAHTSDSAHTWTKQGGQDLYISGNKAVAGGSDESGHTYSSFVPTDADYTCRADFKVAASGNVSPMIGGRCSTSANTWYGVRYGGGTWYLYSIVAGAETSIGTYVGDEPTTVKQVDLIMAGTTISVEIGGVERISVTSSTITDKGRPCVGTYYSDTGTDRNIDDYEVYD